MTFSTSVFPRPLRSLIESLKKLPGVGDRSAQRFAFEIASWSQTEQEAFGEALVNITNDLSQCEECGAYIEGECSFCHSPNRDPHLLCVVASPKDLYTFERLPSYRGRYHVIRGLISPLDDRGPETVGVDRLIERVKRCAIREVILALDTTLEGDATALYIKSQLDALENVVVTRLAQGLPIGGHIEYTDPDTLFQAMARRF
ncbi:MAG: recombination protein RecR [Chlamydiia bacterium]|nr:recombination protein RecR [Chlamydiia bacterium]